MSESERSSEAMLRVASDPRLLAIAREMEAYLEFQARMGEPYTAYDIVWHLFTRRLL